MDLSRLMQARLSHWRSSHVQWQDVQPGSSPITLARGVRCGRRGCWWCGCHRKQRCCYFGQRSQNGKKSQLQTGRSCGWRSSSEQHRQGASPRNTAASGEANKCLAGHAEKEKECGIDEPGAWLQRQLWQPRSFAQPTRELCASGLPRVRIAGEIPRPGPAPTDNHRQLYTHPQ